MTTSFRLFWNGHIGVSFERYLISSCLHVNFDETLFHEKKTIRLFEKYMIYAHYIFITE